MSEKIYRAGPGGLVVRGRRHAAGAAIENAERLVPNLTAMIRVGKVAVDRGAATGGSPARVTSVNVLRPSQAVRAAVEATGSPASPPAEEPGQPEGVDAQESTNEPTGDRGAAVLGLLDHNLTDLGDLLAKIDDAEDLDLLLDAENAGKTRKGAVDLIEARLIEVLG